MGVHRLTDGGGLVLVRALFDRFGLAGRQAGAERGYNPKKRGLPSHHPLLAYVRETGRLPRGVLAGEQRAHTAEGAEEWLEKLVGRLRGTGVCDITV